MTVRSVCRTSTCIRMRMRTHEVPAAGESIQLVEIGTHCRGAIFLDGARRLPRSRRSHRPHRQDFDGVLLRLLTSVFLATRFVAGRNMKIIELKRVTSGSHPLYDPAQPLRRLACVYLNSGESLRNWKSQPCAGRATSLVADLLSLTREYRRLAQGIRNDLEGRLDSLVAHSRSMMVCAGIFLSVSAVPCPVRPCWPLRQLPPHESTSRTGGTLSNGNFDSNQNRRR